jgi:transcriptional regulator with XRE-family HTH domain
MANYYIDKGNRQFGERKRGECMELDLEKIKHLRKKNKISLAEMATFLGYGSASGWYYVESGRCKAKPNHIPLIASKLNVQIIELYVEETDDRQNGEATSA